MTSGTEAGAQSRTRLPGWRRDTEDQAITVRGKREGQGRGRQEAQACVHNGMGSPPPSRRAAGRARVNGDLSTEGPRARACGPGGLNNRQVPSPGLEAGVHNQGPAGPVPTEARGMRPRPLPSSGGRRAPSGSVACRLNSPIPASSHPVLPLCVSVSDVPFHKDAHAIGLGAHPAPE